MARKEKERSLFLMRVAEEWERGGAIYFPSAGCPEAMGRYWVSPALPETCRGSVVPGGRNAENTVTLPPAKKEPAA